VTIIPFGPCFITVCENIWFVKHSTCVLDKEEDTSNVTEAQDAVGTYVNSLESITKEEDGNYCRRLLCVYVQSMPRVLFTPPWKAHSGKRMEIHRVHGVCYLRIHRTPAIIVTLLDCCRLNTQGVDEAKTTSDFFAFFLLIHK
jgi:hypothetical protein